MIDDWKPGDVAMVKVAMYDEPRIMFRIESNYWVDTKGSDYWHKGQGIWAIESVRPLNVTDPEGVPS